jgi:hypothetical protein
MAPMALVAGLVPVLFAAYFLLLAPGQAWWRGRASAAPRFFIRVAVSVAFTTAVGLVLAYFESFSLPRLIVVNALSALVGYLWVGRIRIDGVTWSDTGRASVLVAVLAFVAFWPPFEVHVGASDATTYVDAGIRLARTHTLAVPDPVGASIHPMAAPRLFDSIFGNPFKPPYHRVPGGLVRENHTAAIAYPTFFPSPMVWSAIFADAFGARYAGGYAALFCALAVWGGWLVARKRLGFAASALTTALMALNAAAFWAGRFPLSEPLVWFFVWAGFVAYDAWEEEGMAADCRVAGLMLGSAAVVRPEVAAFLVVVFAAVRTFGVGSGMRRLTFGFYATFAAAAGAAFCAATLLPGGYTAPFFDGVEIAGYILEVTWVSRPFAFVATAAFAAVAVAMAAKRLGPVRALAAAIFFGSVLAYVRTSHFEGIRSTVWLGHYLGWVTVAFAVAGGYFSWNRRHARPADTFFVLAFAIFGVLLVWDPHVMPVMPWASRRYVPVVIPAGLLMAGVAASRIGARNALAGVLAWAVLAAGVLWPARDVLSTDYFGGTYDQLAEFEALLPEQGTFFIDGELDSLILGVPLWLLFERENLPIRMRQWNGTKLLAGLTYQLGPEFRPVYLITPALSQPPRLPRVAATPVDAFVFSLALPPTHPSRPPLGRERFVLPVSLLRLSPAPFANRAKPPARPQAAEPSP